jgi:hypothetical protein
MHPAPLTLRQTRLARSTLTRPLLLRQHRSYYSARSAASASFTTDPRRCATSSAAAAVAAAAASIYFFTMQTAGAACIRNSPSTSSSPHESVRCYIYGAMQPAERSSCERHRERETPPSFLIPRASSFQTALFGVWFRSRGMGISVILAFVACRRHSLTPKCTPLYFSDQNALAMHF